MLAQLFAHAVKRAEGKPAFHFSRFNFLCMKGHGNTHYCFLCGGGIGFTPDKDGNPTNHAEKNYDPMKEHNVVTHAIYVLGDADKYNSPEDWLHATLTEDFPCRVSIYGHCFHI
jgi:hypothetical protein